MRRYFNVVISRVKELLDDQLNTLEPAGHKIEVSTTTIIFRILASLLDTLGNDGCWWSGGISVCSRFDTRMEQR